MEVFTSYANINRLLCFNYIQNMKKNTPFAAAFLQNLLICVGIKPHCIAALFFGLIQHLVSNAH